MPPRSPSFPPPPDGTAAGTADRLRHLVGVCERRALSAERACEAKLAASARSVEMGTRLVVETNDRVLVSRELLRRSG